MIKRTMYGIILALSMASCGNSGNESRSANSNDTSTNTNTAATSEEGGTATTTDTAANAGTTTPGNTGTGGASASTTGGGGKAMSISKKEADAGLALITKSDCLTCHKVDQKVVGPAYKDVAAKYPATEENIEKLADKVISGGAGNWGQIPMTPHPQLSKDDAKQMVKYVLAQK